MSIVPTALHVELTTQLGEEKSEVLFVLRPLGVSPETTFDGKLPVDVDAVEESRPAPDEKIDGRAGELASRFVSQRGIGESRRSRPAANRDRQLEMRVMRLEAPQFAEIST